MNRQARQHRGGFTLLELLLASFIVALLMASLYSALHAGYKARASINAASQKVRSARVALDLIEQNLRSILPPSQTGILAGPFTGTQNEIDCYCLVRDYGKDTDPMSDGMRYVSILMDSSNNAPDLVQQVQRNLLPSGAVTPETEIIASNVTNFTVSYYDGSDWQDEWDSTQQNNTLPVAVQVTVTVQPVTNGPSYTLSRTIALPCGVNVNSSSSTSSSSGSSS